MSAGNAGDEGVTFEQLVAVATLGVSRKGFAVTELAGLAGLAGEHAPVLEAGDPAAALLDAAALLTVAGRAGVRPAVGVRTAAGVRPQKVSAEDLTPYSGLTLGATETAGPREDAAPQGTTGRELSARAVRLLRRIGRADLQRGFAAADTDLITDLLTAAHDAGYVAAAPILPDLLDAAVRKEALRPVVAAVLGARGLWLAGHRPDWRQVVAETGTAIGGATGTGRAELADREPAKREPAEREPAEREPAKREPAGDAAEPAPEVWRTGGQQERLRFLIGLRRRDPRAARQLLAAGWALETADDRATLLLVLAHGLSAADEEFLEAALDDRAGRVREVARALLGRLPGSAYNGRARERAAAVLRLAAAAVPVHEDAPARFVAPGGGTSPGQDVTRVLVVTLPGMVDAAGARDGLSDRVAAPRIGGAAWLLTQVIAAAPLASWTERFGLSPAEIVALPMVTGPMVTGPMVPGPTSTDALTTDAGPLEGGLALAVRAGWRLAAVRQRGVAATGLATETTTGGSTTAGDWALALLAADPPYAGAGRPPAAWPPAESLAALLPRQARAVRLAAILEETAIGDVRGTYAAATELADFPVPWPGVLADAVVGVLARSATRRELAPLTRAVLGAAARGLPTGGDRDYAAELTRLANAMPQTWSPMLHTTAETIARRRAFLAELR